MTATGTFIFICPACGYKARLPDEISGSTIKCPGCQVPQMARAQVNTERKTASFIRVAATPVPFTLPKEQENALNAAPEPTPATMQLPIQSPLPGTLGATTERVRKGDPPPSAKPAAVGTINFVCSACHARMRLPAHYSGKSILCPKCSSPQRVVPQSSDAIDPSRVIGTSSTVRPTVQVTPLPGQSYPTPVPTAPATASVARPIAAPAAQAPASVARPIAAPAAQAPVAPLAMPASAPIAPPAAAQPAAAPIAEAASAPVAPAAQPASEFNPTISETAAAPVAEAAAPTGPATDASPFTTPAAGTPTIPGESGTPAAVDSAPAAEADLELGSSNAQFEKPHPSKSKNPTVAITRKSTTARHDAPSVPAAPARSSSGLVVITGVLGVLVIILAAGLIYHMLALGEAHNRQVTAEQNAQTAAQREQQATAKIKDLEAEVAELKLKLKLSGDAKTPEAAVTTEPPKAAEPHTPDEPAAHEPKALDKPADKPVIADPAPAEPAKDKPAP